MTVDSIWQDIRESGQLLYWIYFKPFTWRVTPSFLILPKNVSRVAKIFFGQLKTFLSPLNPRYCYYTAEEDPVKPRH